jgi:hypothetical protein
MTPKKYITQLTGEDMKELAQATNLEPGFLIRIEKSQGKIKIGIDENALALAINGFYRNGGCNTNAANCVNVQFDPPS